MIELHHLLHLLTTQVSKSILRKISTSTYKELNTTYDKQLYVATAIKSALDEIASEVNNYLEKLKRN